MFLKAVIRILTRLAKRRGGVVHFYPDNRDPDFHKTKSHVLFIEVGGESYHIILSDMGDVKTHHTDDS